MFGDCTIQVKYDSVSDFSSEIFLSRNHKFIYVGCYYFLVWCSFIDVLNGKLSSDNCDFVSQVYFCLACMCVSL